MKRIFTIFLGTLLLLSSIKSYAQFGWISQPSGTTQNLNSIWASNSFSVYTVGNAGVARRTSNKGATWSTMNIGSVQSHNSIRFTNSGGFMVGTGQEILQTTNGGNSWSSIGVGTTTLNDFFFTNSNGGWVVGDLEVGYGFLYNSKTFQLFQSSDLANKNLRGIYFTSLSDGYVVGDGGLILRTNNGGNYWFKLTSGTIQQLNKIMFLNSTTGIIVGNGGTILKTTNGGSSWTSLNSGTTTNLNAVYFPDANNIFVCGDNGTILFSNNGGTTWQTEPTGSNVKLNSIHGDGISDIWACGNNGTILYRTILSGVNNNQETEEKLNIFPNPTSGKVTIIANGFHAGTYKLHLFNMLGQEVKRFNLAAEVSHSFTVTDLEVGTYFYSISDAQEAQIKTGKLVVVK